MSEIKDIDKFKIFHKISDKECRICNKPVYITDTFEIICNKRKTSYLIHTDCIIKAAKGEI